MFCAIAALRRDSCKRALDFCSSQLVPKSRLTIKFYSVTSGARRRRFWELLQPPLRPFVSTVATSPFRSLTAATGALSPIVFSSNIRTERDQTSPCFVPGVAVRQPRARRLHHVGRRAASTSLTELTGSN